MITFGIMDHRFWRLNILFTHRFSWEWQQIRQSSNHIINLNKDLKKISESISGIKPPHNSSAVCQSTCTLTRSQSSSWHYWRRWQHSSISSNVDLLSVGFKFVILKINKEAVATVIKRPFSPIWIHPHFHGCSQLKNWSVQVFHRRYWHWESNVFILWWSI